MECDTMMTVTLTGNFTCKQKCFATQCYRYFILSHVTQDT